MNYFPVFLDAHKTHALVVGGGNVAARKIELLLKTPAKITIVSNRINSSVERLINQQNLGYINDFYQTKYLTNKTLVIAATNDKLINKQIAEEASRQNLLINVVDSPDLCNYITPAIIDRSPMLVALSSEGSAPILLQMLRNQIETTLPAAYGELAKFCKSKRLLVQQEISQFAQRKQFWKHILDGEVAELIMAGKNLEAEHLFSRALYKKEVIPQGKVNIITIKTNNPDHLTLQTFQILQSTDDVYLCQGVDEIYYDYCRRDADKYHQLSIDHINKKVTKNRQVSILTFDNAIEFIQANLADTSIDCAVEHFACGN